MPPIFQFPLLRHGSNRKKNKSRATILDADKNSTEQRVIEIGETALDIRDIQIPNYGSNALKYWIALHVMGERQSYVKFVKTKCDMSLCALSNLLLREAKIRYKGDYKKPQLYDRKYEVIDLIFTPKIVIHVAYAYRGDDYKDTFDDLYRMINERRLRPYTKY
jgi:hypothetical protein